MAKTLLSLPHSNGTVERVFSSTNFFKNKLRNKLDLTTVNSLLHIKFGLGVNNCCCDTYILPSCVINKIRTLPIYNNNNFENCDEINYILDVSNAETIDKFFVYCLRIYIFYVTNIFLLFFNSSFISFHWRLTLESIVNIFILALSNAFYN